MDKYLILKNGLVATFDEQGHSGVYNIIIKNDKIYDIDFENRLNNDEVIKNIYPKSEILDLKNRLIMPPFINSHLCSSFSLCRVFLKRSTYETLNNNISLNLVSKYFANQKVRNELRNLFKINYTRALSNAEYILNETSNFVSKEYFLDDKSTSIPFGQEVAYTTYDSYLSSYLWNNNKFHFISLKYDEEINNYSLNFLKKSTSKEKNKIFLENLIIRENSESVSRNFGKSFIRVLNDYDLLSSDLVLSNPLFINKNDIELLSEKKVNVVFCLSDLLNLYPAQINLSDFFDSDINICTGTGYLGENVLAELKILYKFLDPDNVSYESLLRTITTNPVKIFERFGYTNTLVKGGIANLIIFDLSDIRNYFDFPENDLNYISQHIIESLDTKDIVDLIIKGNYLIKDYQSKFYEQESLRKIIKEISVKVYDTGKYFELKEKFLMKKRVKKLSTRDDEKSGSVTEEQYMPESSLDIIDNPVLISDSDFKVIGAKVNENLILSSDIISADDNVFKNINEIKSTDSGLFIFGNEDKLISSEKPKHDKGITKEAAKIDKTKLTKVYFDDIKNTSKTEPLPQPEKLKKPKDVKFNKNKLRFGFTEEDS